MQIKVHKIYTLTRIHENCSRIVIEHSDHSLANFKMQKGGTEKCVCFIQICSCHRINLCSTLEIEIEDVHTKPLTPIIYYICNKPRNWFNIWRYWKHIWIWMKSVFKWLFVLLLSKINMLIRINSSKSGQCLGLTIKGIYFTFLKLLVRKRALFSSPLGHALISRVDPNFMHKVLITVQQ